MQRDDVPHERVAHLRRGCSSACASSAHLFLRMTLPDADPYLFPLVAPLACFGLVMIYRHRRRPRARAGAVVRRRADRSSRRRSSLCATTAVLERYRYIDRDRAASCSCCCRACPGSASRSTARTSASASARSPSSPPSSRRSRSSSSSRRYLRDTRQVLVQGAHEILGHDAPAAQAPRAAARGLGRGDGDARLHPRPGLVADVLRRLPGAALRRDEPRVLRDHRARPVRGRRVVLRAAPSGTCRTASTPGCTRSTDQLYDAQGGSYQIAQSLFAQADGGLLGARLRRRRSSSCPAAASCCPPRTPTSSTRSSSTSSGSSARAACCSSTCSSSSAGSASRCSPATRSPSCWRPA